MYEHIRPHSTRPARAHGLPKTHKAFDVLPPFRPIIDTTGTAFHPVAKYLSPLLSPLTQNEFSLKDSFDAVTRSTPFHQSCLPKDTALYFSMLSPYSPTSPWN